MPSAAEHKPGPEPSGNLHGGAWLMADMVLNIWALTIVKALGLDYPATQIVFLRAFVGMLIMLPWIWRSRHLFQSLDNLHLHISRVVLSTLALTAGFFAIARLPFALVSAIGFTRPIVTMLMAMVFLNESIARRRWWAAAIAFVGVIIAVEPGALPWSWGLPAMFLTVLFGTSAIILTRRLRETPTVVMMAFYTIGLTIFTAPFAYVGWNPIAAHHLAPLLAIGLFSQCAQFCFLRAHANAEAGFLSILGYLSLLLTTGVGYFVFDEVPSLTFAIGAALIVVAAMWTTLSHKQTR